MDIIARDAPTGDLTCRFVDYTVAEALRDANVAVNATETAYVAADAWASSQGDILGFISPRPRRPIRPPTTNGSPPSTRRRRRTPTRWSPPRSPSLSTPSSSARRRRERGRDHDGAMRDGRRRRSDATVGRRERRRPEGVDSVGAHYPLTPSEVTMLSADVRVRRTALDAVSPTSRRRAKGGHACRSPRCSCAGR